LKITALKSGFGILNSENSENPENYWKIQLSFFALEKILCDILLDSNFTSNEETWKISFESRILERKKI